MVDGVRGGGWGGDDGKENNRDGQIRREGREWKQRRDDKNRWVGRVEVNRRKERGQ